MLEKRDRLLLKRIDIDFEIEEGFKFKAADRLANMLRANPEDMYLWNMLGELYYDSGFYDAAGKYWLMYPSNEYHIVKCIEIYRESMNHSATRILNDIKFRGDKSKLTNFSREILEELEEESKNEGGYVHRSPIVRITDETLNSETNWFKEAVWMLLKVLFLLFLSAGIIAALSWFHSLIR